MASGDRQQEVLDFVNKGLEKSLGESDILFEAWKNTLYIHDMKVYHTVAQQTGQKELLQNGGKLCYTIGIPRWAGDSFGDPCNVMLSNGHDADFLDQYGEHYEVKELQQ